MELVQGVVKDWNAVKKDRHIQYKHLVVGERNLKGLIVSDTLDDYLSRSNKSSTPITLFCNKTEQGLYCSGVEFQGKVYIMGLELKNTATDLRNLVWSGPILGVVGFIMFGSAMKGSGGESLGTIGFFLMFLGIAMSCFFTAPLILKSSAVNAIHKFAKEAEKEAKEKGFDIIALTAD